MENEGSSIQLLFAQTRIGYVLCVSHVIFPCVVFLFYCVVISDYGLFILVTRDGLYPYMGLKRMESVEASKYFLYPFNLPLKPLTLSAQRKTNCASESTMLAALLSKLNFFGS